MSNQVRYYKTVQEAIASANPSMRKFLCATPGTKEATSALLKRLGELKSQEFIPENYSTLGDLFTSVKNLVSSQGEEQTLVKALEKCISFLSKGEVGDAIFKLKLKQDKGFAEVLKGVGFVV